MHIKAISLPIGDDIAWKLKKKNETPTHFFNNKFVTAVSHIFSMQTE